MPRQGETTAAFVGSISGVTTTSAFCSRTLWCPLFYLGGVEAESSSNGVEVGDGDRGAVSSHRPCRWRRPPAAAPQWGKRTDRRVGMATADTDGNTLRS